MFGKINGDPNALRPPNGVKFEVRISALHLILVFVQPSHHHDSYRPTPRRHTDYTHPVALTSSADVEMCPYQ